ncbi:MAG: OmpH family outer membrane protein [Candidatus Omnitrophica bacterium]|nr:OmpH family outer membrane protein [Candidatus Omnitrophota bacterium]
MKKINVLSLFALMMIFSTAFFSLSAQAAEKYAFINVAEVFDKYQKTVDHDRGLQETGKKKEEERDVIVRTIRQLKDELVLLNDDAKATKQEALDAKIRELQEFDRAAKQELGENRRDVIQEIFKDIDDVVQAYGKREGYDLIFNERALIYRSDKFDITQPVLEELNKTYGGKKK